MWCLGLALRETHKEHRGEPIFIPTVSFTISFNPRQVLFSHSIGKEAASHHNV